jgi:hypothetical protein
MEQIVVLRARKMLYALVLATLTLPACAEKSGSVETLGSPTLIPIGRRALEVLCDIQAEFRSLPKPILRDVIYHKPTSRRMLVEFHLTSEKLPAYFEFVVSDQAKQWMVTHTSAELSAALMPLVQDGDIGGEAAVLLTALATGRNYRVASYGYHTSSISSAVSRFMHDTRYRSPSNTGNWNLEAALQFSLPTEVALSFHRWQQEVHSKHNSDGTAHRGATLDGLLAPFQLDLRYYENGLNEYQFYGIDAFENVQTLDQWIPSNSLPSPPDGERHRRLLEDWGKSFVILAAYPLGVPRGVAVYELGFERYWPLLYNFNHTVKELNKQYARQEEYRRAFRRAVKRTVYEHSRDVCRHNLTAAMPPANY